MALKALLILAVLLMSAGPALSPTEKSFYPKNAGFCEMVKKWKAIMEEMRQLPINRSVPFAERRCHLKREALWDTTNTTR